MYTSICSLCSLYITLYCAIYHLRHQTVLEAKQFCHIFRVMSIVTEKRVLVVARLIVK